MSPGDPMLARDSRVEKGDDEQPHSRHDRQPPVQRTADVELTIPARPENVAVVRHVLGGVGEALGLDAPTLGGLRLAVSEACTNVVVHAYPDDEVGLLEVEAVVDPPLLHVTVRDRGRGFAPRPDSPGLGMGLSMIAAVTRTLEVGSEPDGSHEVRMTFVVADAAAPDAVGGS
ncbi:MAG: ATP-binding protein [Solirubrobacteraceae bacterium]|nr:ATP-binding protein [Solirubrobacteraceae bacterium]